HQYIFYIFEKKHTFSNGALSGSLRTCKNRKIRNFQLTVFHRSQFMNQYFLHKPSPLLSTIINFSLIALYLFITVITSYFSVIRTSVYRQYVKSNTPSSCGFACLHGKFIILWYTAPG